MAIYQFRHLKSGKIKEFSVPMTEISSFIPPKNYVREYSAPNCMVVKRKFKAKPKKHYSPQESKERAEFNAGKGKRSFLTS